MIFCNNILAKTFIKNKQKYFIRIGCLFFVAPKYLEFWEETEPEIRTKQYWECFMLAIIPSLALSAMLSWWCMIIPFLAHDILYFAEKLMTSHSIFDWEAQAHAGVPLYTRKRKAFPWLKGYGRKNLPQDVWQD